MASPEDIQRATPRGKELRATIPHAVSASYDRRSGRIAVSLSSHLVLGFLPADVEGLEHATPAQLAAMEICPSGFGLHFPALDADIYLPGLLEGLLGSTSWMASRLGRAGG